MAARRCTWPPSRASARPCAALAAAGANLERAGERPLRRGDDCRRGRRRRDAARAAGAGASAKLTTSRYDGTALIAAAHLGHDGVVRQLIAAGAPLDHVNNLHWTAVIEADRARRRRRAPPGHAARAGRTRRQLAARPTAAAARRWSWLAIAAMPRWSRCSPGQAHAEACGAKTCGDDAAVSNSRAGSRSANNAALAAGAIGVASISSRRSHSRAGY